MKLQEQSPQTQSNSSAHSIGSNFLPLSKAPHLPKRSRPGTAVSRWPKHPSIYEINTWVWLTELSAKMGRRVDLGSVPSADWDSLAKFGFDAVWLMGVWERSPAGIAIANLDEQLLKDFRQALPDFSPRDNVGSPYCVRRFVVERQLGGSKGLAVARQELANRGMNLILDFVPSQVALDHAWVMEHPEYFVSGNPDDTNTDPESWIELEGRIYASGREPNSHALSDVVQLNVFQPQLRRAAIKTLSKIASQCDGIRCEKATLLLNPVFERTWGNRVGPPLPSEYWREVISATKKTNPGFLFIAEARWGMERELLHQGFDFCCDNKLYDRLEHGSAESVRLHLCDDLAHQQKLLRFIENHDEARAATTFSHAKGRAAAVAMATIPGAKLFNEGQLEGRKIRLPIFLRRRPNESINQELQAFYARHLKAIRSPAFCEGEWSLCGCESLHADSSVQNLVAWSWLRAGDHCLIVVNLSECRIQTRVQAPSTDAPAESWRLADASSDITCDRDRHEMLAPGFYFELGPWECHFFQSSSVGSGRLTRAAVAGA